MICWMQLLRVRQSSSTHMKTEWTKRDDINNKIYQKWFHKVNPILFRAEKAPPMAPESASTIR